MKKVTYLFGGIFFFSTVFLQAQVRVGGLKEPHPSAILDLNETDNANDGKHGLALPRVFLSSNTAQLNNNTPPNGMIVYNTNKTVGEGIYYWVTDKWVKVANGSFIEGDSIVGNEVTNATPGGGLERAGAGTAKNPYTLGIAKGGVKNEMIAGGAVTGDKMNGMGAAKDDILYYDGAKWAPQSVDSILKAAGSGSESGIKIQFRTGTSTTLTTSYSIGFDKVNLSKTAFILNGHYGSQRFPLDIRAYSDTTVRIPATGSSITGYSLQIIEFK
jgi:hypothetical protein